MSIFRRKILSSIRSIAEKKHIYPSDWFGIGNDIELEYEEFMLTHRGDDYYLLDCKEGVRTTGSTMDRVYIPTTPYKLYVLENNAWVETVAYDSYLFSIVKPSFTAGSVGYYSAGGSHYDGWNYWWDMVDVTEYVKKGTLSVRNKYVATTSSSAVYQISTDIQNAYKGFAIQCRVTLRCDGKQTRGENGGITFRFGNWCSYQNISAFTITSDTEVGESNETFTRWLYKSRSRESTSATFAEIRFNKTDSAGYEIGSDVRLFAKPMD